MERRNLSILADRVRAWLSGTARDQSAGARDQSAGARDQSAGARDQSAGARDQSAGAPVASLRGLMNFPDRVRALVFLGLALYLICAGVRIQLSQHRVAVLRAGLRAPGGLAHRVDLNSASRDEIALIRGIGPARATEIVRMRDRGFRPEGPLDLRAVHGIGFTTIAAASPHICWRSSVAGQGAAGRFRGGGGSGGASHVGDVRGPPDRREGIDGSETFGVNR